MAILARSGAILLEHIIAFFFLAQLDGPQKATEAGDQAANSSQGGMTTLLMLGVMLLIFRPFRTGQYVEIGGIAGTVKELTLFFTELNTPDNVQIIVPNSGVWGQPLKNYSSYPTRRVDITFGISYADDINKAMDIIRSVYEADPRSMKEPEPFLGVIALNDSSVDIVMRLWVANSDYWPTKFDITKKVKERFDAEGITIPFPCRTVYQVAEAAD